MNICFLDFETTGVDVFKDNPIEIGAVLVDEKNQILKEFHSLIEPRTKRAISANALSIHGLNIKSLLNAPSQEDVLNQFFEVMGFDFRFAGWNINFDVTFFRRMCHNNNRMREFNKIYHRHIDIQSIVYFLRERNKFKQEIVSLNDIIDLYKIERYKLHNAFNDAKITFEVYKNLMSVKL